MKTYDIMGWQFMEEYMNLFVTDLDGTLLNANHQLDSKMRDYIIELRAQGHIFGVATGRPYASALNAVPDIPELFDFGVFNNGANFYDFKDGEIHNQYPLKKETIEHILDIYADQLGGNPILVKGEITYTLHRQPYHDRLIQSGFNIKFGPFRDQLEATHEKIIFSVNEETAPALIKHYEANPHEDYVAFMSQAELLEFMDPRINKWVGVEYYLSKYQLKDLTTVSFGDNGNDLQLIQGADIGVAVENAIDVLKDAADHIASHHDELAVYNFIKDYLDKQ